MKHPIIILALYFLSIVAILFSMIGGGSSDKGTDIAESAEVQKAASTEVDISKAPAIEPSTLTSALVDGEAEKKATETTEEKEVTKAAETAESSDETVKTEEASTEVETEVAETDDATASSDTKESTDESTNAVATENTEVAQLAATETKPETENAATETDTQFSEMSADELLVMAREAYWNNGLEESAEIYQQLISASPDIVDYKGELGNVYWRQGFPEKAAELYAEISMPMIESGNADRVANMVGFIGLFYPEKATEIHNKLQSIK